MFLLILLLYLSNWQLIITIPCPFHFVPVFHPAVSILQFPLFVLWLCFHSPLLSRSEINHTYYHSMLFSYTFSYYYYFAVSNLSQIGSPAKEIVHLSGSSPIFLRYSMFFLLEISIHQSHSNSFCKIHHHLSFNIPSFYTISAHHLFIS